jgi:hypothetical protein
MDVAGSLDTGPREKKDHVHRYRATRTGCPGDSRVLARKSAVCARGSGGEGGIRTPGTVARTLVFEDSSPAERIVHPFASHSQLDALIVNGQRPM